MSIRLLGRVERGPSQGNAKKEGEWEGTDHIHDILFFPLAI